MDQRLVAWARAVKRRSKHGAMPPLWLFTDPARMADPVAAVAALPKGLCGVVFRHDGVAGRDALARAMARECRRNQVLMSIAGRPILLPGVMRHLREGRGRAPGGTASAHGVPALLRARRAGCAAAFLSPVFQTMSHPGAAALGPLRWAAMARRGGTFAFALGGIDGATVRRLPRWTRGVGAIGALAAADEPCC